MTVGWQGEDGTPINSKVFEQEPHGGPEGGETEKEWVKDQRDQRGIPTGRIARRKISLLVPKPRTLRGFTFYSILAKLSAYVRI